MRAKRVREVATSLTLFALIYTLLTPALPDAWQDLFGIELEETRLVIAWCVEDQVSEAQLKVGANLLQVLFRVIGDQPAAMRLIGYLGCLALHLTRIMYLHFVFGRESEGRPDARVSQCPCAIGIKGDLDLKGTLDGFWIATGCPGPFLYGREQLVAVQLITLTGCTDKAIANAARVFSGYRATGSNIDGNGLFRLIVYRGVACAVIFPLECNEVFRPELLNQSDRFAQAGQAFFRLRPLQVRNGHLVQRLT